MNAFEIAAALVKPAAGLVDKPGGIFFPDKAGDPVGVELPPAFVEGDPYGDGGNVIQIIDGVQAFFCPAKSWQHAGTF